MLILNTISLQFPLYSTFFTLSTILLQQNIAQNRLYFHYITLSLFCQWWSVRESNPRPRQCECRALSAELTPQHLYYTIKISPCGAYFYNSKTFNASRTVRAGEQTANHISCALSRVDRASSCQPSLGLGVNLALPLLEP